MEDEHRVVKKYGETRIPAGTYKLELRTEGGFHSRYKKKYGFHEGMIWVKDVPGFEYILLHVGNNDENTAGCLLLGQSQESNLVKRDGFVGSSVSAYKYVYPYVLSAIKTRGAEVTYVDFDGSLVDNNGKCQDDIIMKKLENINEKITKNSYKLSGKVLS